MAFRCLLAMLTVLPVGGAAARESSPRQQIRRTILHQQLRDVQLFRGCPSDQAFSTRGRGMAPLKTPEELARAVGSRLMSTSRHVSGYTSCPYTAGCFALGVKDREPETVRIQGSSKGYVGITRGREMPAARFVELLDQHRANLPRLLQTMGECRVVVDASALVQHLGDRYPGILTAGFREMIGPSLAREAEYLAFGREPPVSRVVEVRKDDLIRQDGVSTRFVGGLRDKLGTAPE